MPDFEDPGTAAVPSKKVGRPRSKPGMTSSDHAAAAAKKGKGKGNGKGKGK